MLNFMEDEEKIFRAWLHKYVKIDRKITGVSLADKIGVSNPTVTAYHSGRVIDGERKFPSIPFTVRKSILEITGVSYEEMTAVGKKELAKQTGTIQESDLEELVTKKIKAELEKSSGRKLSGDCIELEHYSVVRDFPEAVRERALIMNQLAVKLTRIAPDSIDDVIDYIEHKLSKQGDRTPIKKTANGLGE